MDNTEEQGIKEELIKKFQKHAQEAGIQLNSNEKIVQGVLFGLLKNKEKFGDIYCPCRVEKIPENVCPCVHHMKEIKEQKHCKCNLFTSKEN